MASLKRVLDARATASRAAALKSDREHIEHLFTRDETLAR